MDSPVLSVDVVSEFVLPALQEGQQVFFVVVDCMRLDHWLAIAPLLSELFNIEQHYHYSILPTATPYSRNAIFSGLFPSDVARLYPQEWRSGWDDDNSRNRHEHQLLDHQIQELDPTLKLDTRYVKVLDIAEGNHLVKKVHSYRSFPLMSVVFNFLDILAHGRSESDILKEMAPNESAYRSLSRSWFSHSSLFEMLRKLAETDTTVVLTTDHGCVMSTTGDRRAWETAIRPPISDTSTANTFGATPGTRSTLRIRMSIACPIWGWVPRTSFRGRTTISSIPTKFNEYQRYYANSFQHGGISLEEMVLPVAVLRGK